MEHVLLEMKTKLTDGFQKLLDESLEIHALKVDLDSVHSSPAASKMISPFQDSTMLHNQSLNPLGGLVRTISPTASTSTLRRAVKFDTAMRDGSRAPIEDAPPVLDRNLPLDPPPLQQHLVRKSPKSHKTRFSSLDEGGTSPPLLNTSPNIQGITGDLADSISVDDRAELHLSPAKLVSQECPSPTSEVPALFVSEGRAEPLHRSRPSNRSNSGGNTRSMNLDPETKAGEALMAAVLSQRSNQSVYSTFSLLEPWEKANEIVRNSHESGAARASRDDPKKALSMQSAQSTPTRNPSGVHGSMSSMSRITSAGEQSKGCVLGPNSRPACTWALWTAVIVMYDMLVVPLVVFQVWDTAEVGWLIWFEWMSLLTWANDIVMTFFTGFSNERKGTIEMRRHMIVRNYCRTWFVLDLLLVLVDVLLLSSRSIALTMLTGLRGFRVLRVVKVIRAIKMSMKWGRVAEILSWFFVSSDRMAAMLSISHNLAVMMVLSHFVACGWYAVGHSSDGNGWADFDQGCEDRWYCYLTAYHWAVTQFTPASMRTDGINTVERAFCIFAVFAGLLVFSAFVGRMTQAMTHLHAMSANARQQRMFAHRYLHENCISMDLATRILSFLHNVRHRTNRLTQEDVSSFDSLPRSLKQRLSEEVFGPHLCEHPLLNWLSEADAPVFNNLCHSALQERTFTPAEEAFHSGMIAEWMLFIIGGKLFYTSVVHPAMRDDLEKGQRLCEIALWCPWYHRGQLTSSMKPSDIVQLNCAIFSSTFSKAIPRKQLYHYARLFIQRACRTSGGSDYVTDTWGSNLDILPIVKMIVPTGFFNPASQLPLLAFATQGDGALLTSVISAWREAARIMRKERQTTIFRHLLLSLTGLLDTFLKKRGYRRRRNGSRELATSFK